MRHASLPQTWHICIEHRWREHLLRIAIIHLMLYPSNALNPLSPRVYAPSGADVWKRVCRQTPRGCLGVHMLTGTESSPKNFAVLVDAENARYSSLAYIMEEMATLGAEVTIRRIYGDFTLQSMAPWKQTSLELSFTPRTVFNYVRGKGAADALMIIEAMDLLHSKRVNGFAIVSSECDFTSLVLRLREERLTVIGFGEKKTPDSFVTACERFVYTENLRRSVDPSTSAGTSLGVIEASASGKPKRKLTRNVLRLLRKVIDDASDESGWINMSLLQSKMLAAKSDWDVRTYGYKRMKECIQAHDDNFELADRAGAIYVRWRIKPRLEEPEVDAEFAEKMIQEKDSDSRNEQVTGQIMREKDVGLFDHNGVVTRAEQPIPLKDLKLNAEVTGKIVRPFSKQGVFVDIGAETNALLPLNMSRHQNKFKKGETVRARILTVNLVKKQITLKLQPQFRMPCLNVAPLSKSLGKSPKPEGKLSAKTPLEELHVGASVKGRITKISEKGAHIDIGASSLAFLPKTQMIQAFGDHQLNEIVEGRILSIDLEKQQICITCKKSLQELKIGDPVHGHVVRNLTYAYLVDIGASKLAILFNNCVSIVHHQLALGDNVSGRILNVDAERLSITCKTALEDLQVGAQVVGKIVEIMPYGVFVDVDASTCALLHKSQVNPPLDTEDITERFTLGAFIHARIQDVDLEKQHLSLTCKEKLYAPRGLRGPIAAARTLERPPDPESQNVTDARLQEVFLDEVKEGHNAMQASSDVQNEAPTEFHGVTDALLREVFLGEVKEGHTAMQASSDVQNEAPTEFDDDITLDSKELESNRLYEADLMQLTLPKLKSQLRAQQLPVTGRKRVLVNRLLSALKATKTANPDEEIEDPMEVAR